MKRENLKGRKAEKIPDGIWPVPSLSTDGYRRYLPRIGAAFSQHPQSPVSILDIGSSFGDSLANFTEALQEQFGVKTATVALDVNRQALIGARSRSNADTLIWGWAQNLPFAAQTFDIVIAKKLASFLPPTHQSQILREITRIVVPTGVVGIELDLQGTEALNQSSHWLLSGEALGRLQKETAGFENYPLPLAQMSGCEPLYYP